MINNSLFKVPEIPNFHPIVDKYYVYMYYDKYKIPFYIGMGKLDRVTQHLYKRKSKDKLHLFFYRKLNKMISRNEKFYYKIILKNLSRNEAITAEQILIKLIGRRDLHQGPLCNLTDGGAGSLGAKITGSKIAIYNTQNLKLVKTFNSILEASKFIGVKESTVRIAENKYDRTGHPIKYYVLRYDEFPDNVFKYKKPDRKYDNYKFPVISTNKNMTLKFDKVKDCADYFKVSRKTIPYRIKHNVEVDGWRFKYDK